jgi:hypothetical protein
MIDSARGFWLFIAVFVGIGVVYFKTIREVIKRIMGRK